MPGFDGTGPMGQGVRTGRGLGNCSSQAGVVDGRNVEFRRGGGFGRGLGRGRFCGRLFNAYPRVTKEQETEMLKEDAKVLEQELKNVRDKLNELNK
ncbi:DUF5320 domain-containing protein [bacterium]